MKVNSILSDWFRSVNHSNELQIQYEHNLLVFRSEFQMLFLIFFPLKTIKICKKLEVN